MKSFHIAAMTTCLVLGAVLPAGAADERPRSQDNRSVEEQSVQGRITSINRDDRTIVIQNRTYQLLPTSRLTRNSRPVEFDDLERGQTVAGTYKPSAETKLEILSMDVGRNADTAVSAASDRNEAESGTSFAGRIDRVDRSGKTIRINDRTFQVLPTTQIKTARGESATLESIRNNQQVSGMYKESIEGKLELLSLNVGRVEDRDTGGTSDRLQSESGTSFGGRVDRVSPAAKSFRINDRTFHILPTTQIKTAEGQPMTLDAMRDNQRVTGTYKESAEGRLEVLTLTVGRQRD
jgi:hypothetical protein